MVSDASLEASDASVDSTSEFGAAADSTADVDAGVARDSADAAIAIPLSCLGLPLNCGAPTAESCSPKLRLLPSMVGS